ncbi:MAG TPA: FGGY family carbohydrate kinase [Candidatus Hydrogenedentes bacterium]|nr:FGGY family carbohydrate kinase [Candidatus Hydrogenedentota bacterium]HQH50931.1 FGGY family carbohydrate kinase [Candidatus Hydrogenedentota bacterium]
MSFLGIDVGTTGCKTCAFSQDGTLLASAYREYDYSVPRPGWAELDARAVWHEIKDCIAQVSAACARNPISALGVSSLGEATVPVSREREILGPSLLNFDERGAEFLDELAARLDDGRLYRINGNTLGNHYGLTKLLWRQAHQPELWNRTHKFLLWGGFVSYMLGAEAFTDYSLANRTLLFDVNAQAWSDELLAWAGIDPSKLPDTVPSGTVIGRVSASIGHELGLSPSAAIVTGAHDQCSNAVGAGVLGPGDALLGMGTFLCAAPVFERRREPEAMLPHGLNTEHHAVPGRFITFIYNQGGSLLKWYRDTFAAPEHRAAQEAGESVYPRLLAEMPDGPANVTVLPHFTTTGPPEFVSGSSGVMAGLRLETKRGEILRGILEGTVFYLRECLERAHSAGIDVTRFSAVGGGSKSEIWLQMTADILKTPLVRPKQTEAGALGAAMLAAVGTSAFASLEEAVEAMVTPGRAFEPRPEVSEQYESRFERYKMLWPLMREYLQGRP